jgi:hypothetical protein
MGPYAVRAGAFSSLGPFSCLIHRSAWKGNSPKFIFKCLNRGPSGLIAPTPSPRMLASKDLRGAVFNAADLEAAELYKANLEGGYFEGADLHNTIAVQTNFESSYLAVANFSGANLTKANLEGACLQGACFEGAVLEGTCLKGAFLEGASGLNLINRQAGCPLNPPPPRAARLLSCLCRRFWAVWGGMLGRAELRLDGVLRTSSSGIVTWHIPYPALALRKMSMWPIDWTPPR